MKHSLLHRTSSLVIALLLALSLTQTSFGYSVLTHEAIIDSAWEDSIKPLLLRRFPGTTAEQLREAHAYTYGGAIIQDMGYYPFGSKLFTDLTHYVRSGDFIEALLGEAQDVNEYAFALGALAHYAADNDGHSKAVNLAVPILYPKLRMKFGNDVTYVEDPSAHLKTEFGFDVMQVARGRYAPTNYHDFIGFKVSKHLLERAFQQTYCVEMKDLFADLDLSIGTYRRTASVIIPKMTKVAWETKHDDIEKLTPGVTRDKYLYDLPVASYEKEWGNKYEKPDFLEKTLAFFFSIIPRVGPLKALSFRPATPETEEMFLASFDSAIEDYRALAGQVRAKRLKLMNKNFDTAQPTRPGEYKLADEAYARLLEKLAHHNFENLTPELRQNLLAFYSNLSAPFATKKDRHDWQKTLLAIEQLKTAQPQNKQVVKQ
jgi:hypothetical protein